MLVFLVPFIFILFKIYAIVAQNTIFESKWWIKSSFYTV
jgi:hypothetical protein